MSVNPGFAGQKFMPEALPKMKDLIPKLRANGYNGYIEADGGIDQSTIISCYEAGCRIFVMGNAIFGSEDIGKRISETKFKLDSYLEQTLLDKSQDMNIREDWIKGRKTILDRYEIKGV
jgi:pentose-5-phosphate-3-epimerase